MNPEARLKRAEMKHQAQVETIRASKEVAITVIENPLVDLVAGYLIIEYAQKHGYMGFWSGAAVEAALSGVCVAKAIAPLMPDLLKAGGEVAGLATKLIAV